MARSTITARIALEGDREIRNQFDELTAAGKRTADALSRAFGSVEIGVQAASSIQRVGQAFSQFGQSIGTVITRAGALKLSIEAAGGALLLLTKNAGDTAAKIGQNAEALGLSTSKYQAFQALAAEGGVSANQFGSAIRQLAQQITQAGDRAKKSGNDLTTGIRPALETFAEGAVTVRRFGPDYADGGDDFEKFADQVTGRGKNDIAQTLRAIANAFKGIPDGARKTAFASRLLGEEVGGQFIKQLNKGGAALDEFVAQFEKSNLVISDTEIGIGTKQKTALVRLGDALDKTRTKLGLLFAPALTAGADAFTKWLEENQTAIREFGLTVAVNVLAVINDIKSAFNGNDANVRSGWVLDARDAFVALKDGAVLAYTVGIKPLFDFIKSGADTVASAINNLFGTRLTGGSLLASVAILKLLGVFGLLASTVKLLGLAFNGLGNTLKFTSGLLEGLGISRTAQAVIGLTALLVANIAKWDDIKAAATNAKDAFDKALTGDFAGAFEELKKSSATTWAIIAADAAVAILAISRIIGAVTLAAAGGPIGWLILGGLTIGAAIGLFWEPIKAALSTAIQTGGEIWAGFKSDALQAWADIGNGLSSAFRSAADAASGALSFISSGLQSILDLARSAASAIGSVFSGAANGGGGTDAMGNRFASGGYVSGRGSSTSDSIPAWLSNGEFVVRAAAVKKYGLGLLQSINGLSAGGFKMGMPAFAGGGLVGSLPSLASASPSSIVNLTIGTETFAGLRASDDVAERLARYAAKRVVASAGKRPSWMGG